MISLCPSCSNIDMEHLESLVDASLIEETCLGLCGANFDKSIAYVKGQWIEVDTEEEFFETLKAML